MSYHDRIRTCRSHDPSLFRPFRIGNAAVGHVKHEQARLLAGWPEVFEVDDDGVTLAPSLTDYDARTVAVAEVVRRLAERGELPAWRGEAFGVVEAWDSDPVMELDRCAVSAFGVPAFGIHVNGFVRAPDGLRLWVGRRAADAYTAPSGLDHLVAGGQPVGLTLEENLRKEAAEEASIPAWLADRAVSVGTLSYRMDIPAGLRNDTLFLYDLEIPVDFEPQNTDGELQAFYLWSVDEVKARVRDTEEFKFNVAPVVIDFLLRHGHLEGEENPFVGRAV